MKNTTLDIETTRNNMEEAGIASESVVGVNWNQDIQRQLLRQFLEESGQSNLIATL